jgi:hypothetical protein
MSKKRTKEHYVQQRYLRFFACDADKQKIHVYDKVANIIRRNQPIEDVACEGGFYDIDFEKYAEENKGSLNQQAFDLFRKNIEETFTDNLLSDYFEPLFDFIDDLVNLFKAGELSIGSNFTSTIIADQRRQISRYIAFQHLRTAAFRNYFIELIGQSNQSETTSILRNPELTKLLHSKMLFNNELVSAITDTNYSGIWILGQAPDGKVFFTSDNPIHLITDIDKKAGIFSNVIFVSYPLLPGLILLIISPKTAKRLGFIESENKIVDLKREGVDWFNKQRIAGAYRVALCSNNELDRAPEMYTEIAGLSGEELTRKSYKL